MRSGGLGDCPLLKRLRRKFDLRRNGMEWKGNCGEVDSERRLEEEREVYILLAVQLEEGTHTRKLKGNVRMKERENGVKSAGLYHCFLI
jgi:hypothetical protein